jgi:hypothetical protein
MKNRRILITAIVSAGVMALAGSAFTASNTIDGEVHHGYGEQVVSGVTAELVRYDLDAARETVETVTLTLTGDTTGLVIDTSWNDTATWERCSNGTDSAGDYDEVEDATTYTCDVADLALTSVVKFHLFASSPELVA